MLRISSTCDHSAFLSKNSGVLPSALHSELWMWLELPARPKLYFAMKVMALPCGVGDFLGAVLQDRRGGRPCRAPRRSAR